MRFKVTTTARSYTKEKVEELKTLGFSFNKHGVQIKMDAKVDISSLEELIAFTEKFGKIVLRPGEIEIYDDWRE